MIGKQRFLDSDIIYPILPEHILCVVNCLCGVTNDKFTEQKLGHLRHPGYNIKI